MLSGRQKIMGGLLVGVTAILVGYAVAKTFSGGVEVNAVNFPDSSLSAEGAPDISLNSSESIVNSDGSDQTAVRAAGDATLVSAQAVVERPRNRVYTVQNNDNFWKIAKKVYGDAKYVNNLCAANAGHKTLRNGMRIICPPFDGAEFRLQLPFADEAATAPNTLVSAPNPMNSIAPEDSALILAAPGVVAEVTPETSSGRTHVVASGENLYDIAKKYYNNGSAWPKIAAANPKINANAIRPGQTLLIP